MSAITLARLRRLWRDVHLWIGVGLFVVIAPLGLTGSLLVLSQPIGHFLEPQRYNAADGPAVLAPSVYLAAARRALGPGAAPTELRYPERPGEPVTASGRMVGRTSSDGFPIWRYAWIDPATGTVRDAGMFGSPLLNLADRFHGSLMIKRLGRKLVGWAGWCLFASAATGLWLWWPRLGPALNGLRWRRTNSILANLHHMIGFWVCIPLAAVSLTGVYICFPKTGQWLARPFLAKPALTPAKVEDLSQTPRLAAPLTVDEAVARALAGRKDAKLLSITLPHDAATPVWTVQLARAGDSLTLSIDGARGVVSEAPPTPPAATLGGEIHKIHGGEALGPVWTILVFLSGLAPTLLGVTGIVMWLRRRKVRAAKA
jgi:uncharacterized iron-regulated membrane protein